MRVELYFIILINFFTLQENSEIVAKKMCGLMAHARSVGQTHSKMS